MTLLHFRPSKVKLLLASLWDDPDTSNKDIAWRYFIYYKNKKPHKNEKDGVTVCV